MSDMKKQDVSITALSQHEQLPIRIVSPGFGHITTALEAGQLPSVRLSYYFMVLMIEGASEYGVDTETVCLNAGELLFMLPNQVRHFPDTSAGSNYFKLGFDEECLSRLPKSYPFLLDPQNRRKIPLATDVKDRLETTFKIVEQLLSIPGTNPELILAHLHTLLTEINIAYFASEAPVPDHKLEKFIDFKLFVENNFTEHPAISLIAEKLAVSTDSLYQIVKQYSGQSPKEFMTNRLILEARRRLHGRQQSTVKELAFELGFNDPDYFSRLFRKVTGKTVARFFQDLS